MLEEQCREVSIFTEMEQVLHVQSVDTVLRVVPDDLVTDEERLVGIGGTEAIQGETTGQTSDRTEQRLERLGHVVRDEVFVDLHHRDD